MNKSLSFIYIFLILNSCAESKKETTPKAFTIITGIAPIASLIQTIAGDNAEVSAIIPVGIDPHSFSLKPSDAIKMAESDVVIALDAHIDGSLLSIPDTIDKTYILNDEESDIEGSVHEGHTHDENPHRWISFVYTPILVERISEILVDHLPEQKDEFISNKNAYIAKLSQTHSSLLGAMNNDKKIAVIQRHGVWDYLLEELDIPLLGTLDQYEGDQSSLKEITETITQIKTSSIPVILIEDAFMKESSVFTQISKEAGAKIQVFNPMVSPNGSSDIIDILEAHTSLLIEYSMES